jgi:hypothetical protein
VGASAAAAVEDPALAVLAAAVLAAAAPAEAGKHLQVMLKGIRHGGPEEKGTV